MVGPVIGRVCSGVGAFLAHARRFGGNAQGGTALEYAMIGGLIFAVIAGSLRLYGSKVDGVYDRIGTAILQAN